MTRLALLVLVACGGHSALDTGQAPASQPGKDAIVKTTENGPVKATVTVWPPKPTLGDPIYLRLDVDAPAGVSIDAPFQEAGDQRMGRFQVTGFQRDTQRKADGGVTSDWEAAAASVNLGGSISHHRPRSKIVRDIAVLVERLTAPAGVARQGRRA